MGNLWKHTDQEVLIISTILVLLVNLANAYVGPSCRSCIVTGDWSACAACYSSKPGIVPFYGMKKRSGEYGFLPGSIFGNSRGDSLYGNVHKRRPEDSREYIGFLPDSMSDYFNSESFKRNQWNGERNYPGFLPGANPYNDYTGDSYKRSSFNRGSDYPGFLPRDSSSFGNYRGETLYDSMSKRSGSLGDSYQDDDTSLLFSEMRERGNYLASYCCVNLGDDECCELAGMVPIYDKRNGGEDFDDNDQDVYYLYEEDACEQCLDKNTFDYAFCLQCIKKKK